MSDTPRTDLFEKARKEAPASLAEHDYSEALAFARQLERELAKCAAAHMRKVVPAPQPEAGRALLIEAAKIAIAKYKRHANEFSEEAIILDAVDAALNGSEPCAAAHMRKVAATAQQTEVAAPVTECIECGCRFDPRWRELTCKPAILPLRLKDFIAMAQKAPDVVGTPVYYAVYPSDESEPQLRLSEEPK